MAVLKVIKGSCPGQLVELHGDRMVVGRHPNCHIVLDNAAVSRNHSQILQSHGSFYLEDLRSRNGTFLNGHRIRGRAELHESDEIKVCDVLFSFHLGVPPTDVPAPLPTVDGKFVAPDGDSSSSDVGGPSSSRILRATAAHDFFAIDDTDSSSIVTSLEVGPSRIPRIAVRPETKLRAILEISTNLARMLELDRVLPKILESLFKIFPQADRGFVVLKDAKSGQLVVKAMETRNPEGVEGARLSRTILNQAMKDAKAILSADAGEDRRFSHSESVAGLQIRSLMCAPLVGHDGVSLGVIQIDTLDVRQQFSQDDLDVLASVAAQAALAVDNATLHASVLKQRDFERELEFATQVQLGFLPTERPKFPDYEFYDFYEAAYRVGGDFFDYVMLRDNRVAVTLGDVAGKGVPAALLMARMYSDARYELLTKPSPAAAMTGLNASISSSGLGHRFVTLVFAVLDPVSHTLTIVNAGHMAPLLRNERGDVLKIGAEESGLPLGVKQNCEYQQVQVKLHPGDTMLLFTDGVTEAMNSKNDLYGTKRLMSYMEQAPAEAEQLGEGLVEDVEQFCEQRAQRDDVCLISFRRLA